MSTESSSTITPTKQFHATTSPWESNIGYYRAVRHGPNIYISGTTATDPNSPPSAPQVLFPGNAKEQTRVIMQEIIKAIQALGGRGAESIVRTKMFVQRQEDCGAVGEGFREILGKEQGGGIGSAATMLVVSGFCDREMLVEVECDAVAVADADAGSS